MDNNDLPHVDLSDLHLNSRQHRFVCFLSSGMKQYEAYSKAGYYGADMGILSAGASDLLALPKISEAVNRLRAHVQAPITQEVSSLADSIMSKAEAEAILSEIARARLRDFQDAEGEPALTDSTPNDRAASEYYHKRQYDRNGNEIVTKSIKLRDPVTAIAGLSKLKGWDAPSRSLVGHVQIEDSIVRKHKVQCDNDTP